MSFCQKMRHNLWLPTLWPTNRPTEPKKLNSTCSRRSETTPFLFFPSQRRPQNRTGMCRKKKKSRRPAQKEEGVLKKIRFYSIVYSFWNLSTIDSTQPKPEPNQLPTLKNHASISTPNKWMVTKKAFFCHLVYFSSFLPQNKFKLD